MLTHLQLAENLWDPERKRAQVKIIYSCGRAGDEETTERLRRLARSILHRCAPEEIVADNPAWQLVQAFRYGDLYVLEQLCRRVGVGEVIYFRMADLVNLDLEIVLYDTTSLHFEIDQPDHGVGPNDEVHGSALAGKKTYRALRKRGHSKNGRFDAPQIVIGLAVTRDDFPVRHWIFPGNTVEVTTAARVKEDLNGWHLSRCVFVGDAGMVSAESLSTLARAGGKYIVCMPIHRVRTTAGAKWPTTC